MVRISEFYENANIFITGATGFIGKALVEKLLRSCHGIGYIYLLIREKRGKTVEQRMHDFCNNPVFDIIKKTNPEVMGKIRAILGDISLPNLGISDRDRSILVEHIDIVFHSAATISFNEDIKTAVKLNVFGTQYIVELCKEMKHLKSFLYISTAYSNTDNEEVEEIVYDLPAPTKLILDNLKLSEDAIYEVAKALLNKHPNTYTLTKAMAEQMVLESSDEIPSAIVRPSIVIAAWKEPYPGWTDSISGCTGVSMACGRGIINTIIGNGNCTADLIPVDLVVDTIITVAWHTVAERPNVMRTYNCVSGALNPITWTRVRELILKYTRQYPSKYVTWYPEFSYRMNRNTHSLCIFLYHTVPSALLDLYLYCTNRKPVVLKLSKKIDSVVEGFSFFLTHQWDFKISNMRSLMRAVKKAEDHANFQVDVSGIDWDDYWKNYMIGIRKWLLKDEIGSLPEATLKLNRLYWIQKICHISMSVLLILSSIFVLKYLY